MPNESLDFRIEAISRKFTLDSFARPSQLDFQLIKAAMLRAAAETVNYIVEAEDEQSEQEIES